MFDIIFLIILVVFFVFSYLRGVVRELFSLLGLAGGFLAAIRWAPLAAERMSSVLPETGAAELLAFVLIIVAGYFVGMFLGGLTDIVRASGQSGSARLAGGVIGLGKGWTMSLALYWVVITHIPAFQDEMAESQIASWLAWTVSQLQQNNLI